MDLNDEYIFKQECEKATIYKNNISSNLEEWTHCLEENVQVGDIIYISYYPVSQKYMYSYHPEVGTVVKIEHDTYFCPSEEKNKKELSIHIINHNGELSKLNKDHLSIYSKGYFTDIKKFSPLV